MPQPPKLTDEQRRAALVKAGEARRVRAETKELLKTGSLRLSELFEQAATDKILAGIKVERLIASMPGMGRIKAKRLMEVARHRGEQAHPRAGAQSESRSHRRVHVKWQAGS